MVCSPGGNQKAVAFDSSDHDDGFLDDGNSKWVQKIRRGELFRKPLDIKKLKTVLRDQH